MCADEVAGARIITGRVNSNIMIYIISTEINLPSTRIKSETGRLKRICSVSFLRSSDQTPIVNKEITIAEIYGMCEKYCANPDSVTERFAPVRKKGIAVPSKKNKREQRATGEKNIWCNSLYRSVLN